MILFSERLKELRLELGLSRVALANALKTSVRLVSYWENGQRECSFEMLVAIADFLHTTTDYLLGRTDF